MTKRKDVVRRLEQAGFCSQGGTKHEKFTHPDGRTVLVPRHREVPDTTAKAILRQDCGNGWRPGLFGVYEFEIFQEAEWYVALPYDFDGGTEGGDFRELCEMVADWLKMTLEDYAIRGEEPPLATFGNEPRHGGQNLLVGVEASRETVKKVIASEAARMLGVTPGRVTQMLAARQLEGWRDGTRTWVTLDSVEARLKEQPKPGRPRKKAAAI